MQTQLVLLISLMATNLFAAKPANFPKIEDKFLGSNKRNWSVNLGKNGSLFIFTSEHCPFDLDWRTRFVGAARWARKKGLNVYMVNAYDENLFEHNNLEKMQQTKSELGFSFPYVKDNNGQLAQLLKVPRTPYAYLFNGDGQLVYSGAIDNDPTDGSKVSKKYLMSALQNLIAKRPIVPSETQTLGCKLKAGG